METLAEKMHEIADSCLQDTVRVKKGEVKKLKTCKAEIFPHACYSLDHSSETKRLEEFITLITA